MNHKIKNKQTIKADIMIKKSPHLESQTWKVKKNPSFLCSIFNKDLK